MSVAEPPSPADRSRVHGRRPSAGSPRCWLLCRRSSALVVLLVGPRVITGADDLDLVAAPSSAALVAGRADRAWPASAACGPSAPAWSTSASRA